MKELYYTGLIFFCLGSLMLFLHHLVSSAARHLASYMGEPIPLNNGFIYTFCIIYRDGSSTS